MAILDLINKKINELKKNSPEEISKAYKVLKTINEALEVLDDEEKFQNYDFSVAFNLVNRNVNSFGIIDIEKNLNDIKNILIVKYRFGLKNIGYSEEQSRALYCFRERLTYLKNELEKLIKDNENNKEKEEILENLEDFKKLLEGKGRKKYYTYEMLEALFEVVDYDSLSYEDIEGMIGDLSIAKNNQEENAE